MAFVAPGYWSADYCGDPETSAIDLSALSVAQANASSGGAISAEVTLFLSAASGQQANSSAAASIKQIQVLLGLPSSQWNITPASSISLGVAYNLFASSAMQSNISVSAAIAVSQTPRLIAAPSIQDNIAEASAIAQRHLLVATGSAQSQLSAAAALRAGVPGVSLSQADLDAIVAALINALHATAIPANVVQFNSNAIGGTGRPGDPVRAL